MRTLVRGLGELLITAGLLLLLFLAYQLVWTNVEAERAQANLTEDIRDFWRRERQPLPSREATDPPAVSDPRRARAGQGFGFLHIPRLGSDFEVPVVQGVGTSDLARGVGHYPGTARPGEVGNFAVAGHRATNGEPFANLDRVRVGDLVIAETRDTWFSYAVDEIRIVAPDDVWVVDPVPGRPGATPTRRLVTLTTCNPRWASTERLIVFGHLRESRSRSEGPPAVLARGS